MRYRALQDRIAGEKRKREGDEVSQTLQAATPFTVAAPARATQAATQAAMTTPTQAPPTTPATTGKQTTLPD